MTLFSIDREKSAAPSEVDRMVGYWIADGVLVPVVETTDEVWVSSINGTHLVIEEDDLDEPKAVDTVMAVPAMNVYLVPKEDS